MTVTDSEMCALADDLAYQFRGGGMPPSRIITLCRQFKGADSEMTALLNSLAEGEDARNLPSVYAAVIAWKTGQPASVVIPALLNALIAENKELLRISQEALANAPASPLLLSDTDSAKVMEFLINQAKEKEAKS